MSDSTRLKSTVYVGGLDQAVSAHTLAEAFVPFGEVVDISLPKPDAPNSTDAHRGFGYVEFDLPEDAKEAIDNMDGSEIYGRTIKVAAAKPQKDANEGLGSKTAIWEQVGGVLITAVVAFLLITVHIYRKGIWPSMLSARRTAKQPEKLKRQAIAHKTQCRAWNSSIWLDRSPSEAHQNDGHDDYEIPRTTIILSKIHFQSPTPRQPGICTHAPVPSTSDFLHQFFGAFNRLKQYKRQEIQKKTWDRISRGSKKYDGTFSARGSQGCCGRDAESCRS